ncbi:diguanylate cyclase [Clostridium sp. CS001]|uniref:GGDEF domain-containing response regulator n=1 Tax=Clostridium sp. CS001 TaxID=2880648 RepID=UPI001CF2A3DF|nr:response regulator [Clostridium sp. CS001]MCB2288688.1 diguanylate cyclase [Clostridium sp. CS001]
MLKVLHVDENLFYKEVLKGISIEMDFKYFFSSKPLKAFEIISSNKIDLIITSLQFQGNETGEEFIQQLKESEYKSIPIIVLTSADNQQLKERLINIGILDFLKKDDFYEKLILHISKLRTGDFLSYQLQNMKIAVLDDDKLQLLMINDVFKNNNITNVDYYTNSKDLLSSNQEYCIYIIDYMLPYISGDKVIEKIRIKDEYSVIMVISSVEDQNVISTIFSIGADDYITKPYSANIFLARLKANVRTYNLLRKLKEKNSKLEQIIKIDGFTGLLDHKYIIEQLEQEIIKYSRGRSPLSIMMLDIDGFKLINDNYGHQCGDEVVLELSNLLQGSLPKISFIGRYGGDEFLIVIPESNLADSCSIGESLRKEIESLYFSKDKIKLTISIGIVELRNEDSFELIKRADDLLYKAKNNGKNRIEY